MAEHGGYRRPEHPAPASGPGALSKRTDGGPGQPVRVMTDQPYGAREEAIQQQQGAPLSEQAAVQPVQAQVARGGGAPAGPGFGAGTARPGEPVTAGAAVGPGPGPSALGFQTPQQMPTGYITDLLTRLSPTDTTGTLARLLEIAKQRGA